MPTRSRITVAATLMSLGGLTAVAMSSGSAGRHGGGVPVADLRTVTVQQTERRYQNLGGGGQTAAGATILSGGRRVAALYRTGAGVQTRASGSRTKYATAVGSGKSPKTTPSGARRVAGAGAPVSAGKAPSSRPSGSKVKPVAGQPAVPPATKASGSAAGSGTAAEPAPAPATKPSGSGAASSGTGTTPAPAPATKPSGSTSGSSGAGAGTETGTTTTPPPSTKASGSSGGGTSGGGEAKGSGGGVRERHDD